jgi:uncharacterized protein YdhG (YjbR/CyaY superfamily)
MRQVQLATVQYQIATYKGKININCNEDMDDDQICSIAEARLQQQHQGLPIGYRSFKVISRV